jgi:hypothetical protein
MHSLASATRCQAAARRAEAFRLRSAGKSYRAIAAELGCSTRTAYTAVVRELEKVRAELAESAGHYLQLEMARLDSLLNAVWPEATAGNLKAVNAAVKVIERQCRLLGLDAPTKTETKVSATADLAGMSDEQLVQEAERLGLHAEAAAYLEHITVNTTTP